MNATQIYQAVKLIETNFGSVDRVDRNEYVSIALGSIAASVAALPSEPLAAPTNHWILQHEGNVKRVFSDLNEMYIFNIPLALKVARQVYLARYRRVFDEALILSELCLFLPDHVSKLPPEVDKVFKDLSEEQKHSFSYVLVSSLKEALGS